MYHNGDRIASHVTSQAKGEYITEPSHLSSNNAAYIKWSPSFFSKLAAPHGIHVQIYIDELIADRPYPEQAYKQVQGILALAKIYTPLIEST